MPDRVESFREVGIQLTHLEDALKKQGDHLLRELTAIKVQLGIIENEIKQDYIRKDTFEARFRPIERLVYSMVLFLLAAIGTAVVSVVLK